MPLNRRINKATNQTLKPSTNNGTSRQHIEQSSRNTTTTRKARPATTTSQCRLMFLDQRKQTDKQTAEKEATETAAGEALLRAEIDQAGKMIMKQYPVSAKSKLSSRDSYRPVMKKYFDLIDNSKYSKDQLDKSQTPESKSRKQQIQSRSAGIDRPLRKSTSKGRKRQESGKDYNNYDDEYQRIDSQYSKERPRQSATREFIITVENSQQTKKLPQSDKKKDLVNNSAEIDDIETLIPQIVRDVYPIGANKNDGEKNLNKLEEVIQEISKLSGGVGIKNNQSKQITKEQCLKGGILYVEPNTEAHKKLSEYYSQAARKLTALWSVLFVPDSQKQEYRQFVQSPQPRSQMTLFNYQLIFNKVESYLPAYELKKQLARNIAIRQYYVDNFLSLNKAGSPFKDLQSLIDNINQYTDICKQGFKQWLCALPWNTTSFLRQRDEFAELMESERTVQNLIDRAKKQTDEK
ncbi:MAG: hypothetical protein EZS28_012452 [Streblomastix strix]|uniref:Uncharacterized protein n=1 Tax=Streblomastix strix TaxID=222440 RepID=A0A5J4WAU5_9EUKA|nr:MAG: hypothetical protein EZS28_012452 [Streblomastix strix]